MRWADLRRWAGLSLMAVALMSVVGAALLTRYPEWRGFDWTERVPVVGTAVRAFRVRYLPLASGRATGVPGGGVLTEFELVETAVGARERVWVVPGSILRVAPSEGSEAVLRLDALASLPVVERLDPWVRVEREDGIGWVIPRPESDLPPRGSRPAPVFPLPSRAPGGGVLADGLATFESEPAEFALGDYRLFIDYRGAGLVGLCQTIELGLERAYAERFGLVPIDVRSWLPSSRRLAWPTIWRSSLARRSMCSASASPTGSARTDVLPKRLLLAPGALAVSVVLSFPDRHFALEPLEHLTAGLVAGLAMGR